MCAPTFTREFPTNQKDRIEPTKSPPPKNLHKHVLLRTISAVLQSPQFAVFKILLKGSLGASKHACKRHLKGFLNAFERPLQGLWKAFKRLVNL